MTLKSLLFCGFSCDQISTRNAKQELVYKCVRCGTEIPVLATAVIRGPQHEQAEVLGKPKTKVFTEDPKVKRMGRKAG